MSSSKHALVVDDNRLNSRLVSVFLKRLGWTASIVDSGEAAMDALADGRFDLVLLDMRMPGMSGEQTCRQIRSQGRLADLPVVAYTAHSMPEERARILACGFNGLLIKPLSFTDLETVCAEFSPVAADANPA